MSIMLFISLHCINPFLSPPVFFTFLSGKWVADERSGGGIWSSLSGEYYEVNMYNVLLYDVWQSLVEVLT